MAHDRPHRPIVQPVTVPSTWRALAQARQAKEQAEAARARAASNPGAAGARSTHGRRRRLTRPSRPRCSSGRCRCRSSSTSGPSGVSPASSSRRSSRRLALEDAGSWVLAKVDVDANPQLSAAAQVQSIPTVLVVWQGQVIPGFQGALPETQVRDFLNQVIALPSQVPGAAATSG